MASTNHCLASLARLSLSSTTRPPAVSIPRFLVPSLTQSRGAQSMAQAAASKARALKRAARKKRQHKDYKVPEVDKLQQFSLCDAIRYVRAFEVGQDPNSVKYDLAVRLKTSKSGAVIRGRIRLPHSIQMDTRVGVICKDSSSAALEARRLGAVVVGEQEVFDMVKSGNISFNRLICHSDSETALMRADVARILGPKGLMPSRKLGTISPDIRGLMLDMLGSEDYRERQGVIRLRIGALGFSPQMLADNVKSVVARIKEETAKLEDETPKQVHEVVLSSTNSPGFSLNGGFQPTMEGLNVKDLDGVM